VEDSVLPLQAGLTGLGGLAGLGGLPPSCQQVRYFRGKGIWVGGLAAQLVEDPGLRFVSL
jgi:hypothetical protein